MGDGIENEKGRWNCILEGDFVMLSPKEMAPTMKRPGQDFSR